jgi:hypothetical protein
LLASGLVSFRTPVAAPVFVTADGKVLSIADPKKAMNFVGDKVKVSGKVDKDKLTIESIAKAS